VIRELCVPPLNAKCRMTVTIPARSEQGFIGSALEALARQPEAAQFDVILFANNCDDATVSVAREAARSRPALQLHVVEATLPPGGDHVGVARRLVMDCAAARFLSAGRPLGIVATTDADTVVAADWAAQTFVAMRTADAVAGFVQIGPEERAAMPHRIRRIYQSETEFRAAWAELEATIDPRPEDPAPRHSSFVGAGFAVSAATYAAAGGLPAVPALEDQAFLAALRRIDARVRHSLLVRAHTSGRRAARVRGGFGTLVSHLYFQASEGRPLLVESPRQILDELESRAALRRLHAGNPRAGDLELVLTLYCVSSKDLFGTLDRSLPFGETRERLLSLSSRRRRYDRVPVDEAIAGLREAAASRNAVTPTRISAASGAG
jgi:hypothetical protein